MHSLSLPLILAVLASPAMAQEVVHRLSPKAREAAIDSASRKPERNPLLMGQAPERAASGRGVHGSVGFGIGTGGMREVFGSTMVPLGENGAAAFSFSTGRYPGFVDGPFSLYGPRGYPLGGYPLGGSPLGAFPRR